jgi:hypothetical protein
MTIESISDKLKEQDQQHETFRNAAKKKGSVGFSDTDTSIEVVEEAIVAGRNIGVNTNEGEVLIEGKVRILRVGGNLIAIPLETRHDSSIINIDDAGKIFTEELQERTKKALAKDRKRRKEKIGAR